MQSVLDNIKRGQNNLKRREKLICKNLMPKPVVREKKNSRPNKFTFLLERGKIERAD